MNKILKHPSIKDLFVSESGDIWFKSDKYFRPKSKGIRCEYPACHLLNKYTDRYGYYYYSLPKCITDLNKLPERKKKKEHQLVAQTFLPNTDNYLYVDHIDSDKQNNHYLNLRWCSRKYNNKKDRDYKVLCNTYTLQNKIKALDLMINKNISVKVVSQMTGIKVNTLYEAKRKSTWKKAWKKFID